MDREQRRHVERRGTFGPGCLLDDGKTAVAQPGAQVLHGDAMDRIAIGRRALGQRISHEQHPGCGHRLAWPGGKQSHAKERWRGKQ